MTIYFYVEERPRAPECRARAKTHKLWGKTERLCRQAAEHHLVSRSYHYMGQAAARELAGKVEVLSYEEDEASEASQPLQGPEGAQRPADDLPEPHPPPPPEKRQRRLDPLAQARESLGRCEEAFRQMDEITTRASRVFREQARVLRALSDRLS